MPHYMLMEIPQNSFAIPLLRSTTESALHVISKFSPLREARRKITATMATMRAATEEQNATITSRVITLVTASRTMRLHVPGMEKINRSHVQVTSY